MDNVWQLREAGNTSDCILLTRRRSPNQDSLRADLPGPSKRLRAVVNDQRARRVNTGIGKDALIIGRPGFKRIDQVSALETLKAVAHAHTRKMALQVIRRLS